MNSSRFLLTGLALFVALTSGALSQGPPDRQQPSRSIFPIWEVPAGWIDVHDGSVLDWEEIVPEPTLTLIDFEGLRLTGYDLESLAGRAFLGWSAEEQRIYFAVERFDDVYVNAYDGSGPSSMLSYDHMSIQIDGDHSGGIYMSLPGDGLSAEEAAEFDSQQAQSYETIVESPDGQLIHINNERKEWAARPPWAEVSGFQVNASPNYSLIEGFITPWDALYTSGPEDSKRSVLEAEDIVGFNIVLWDYDQSPGERPITVYGVSDDAGGYSWRDASMFTDGVLIPLSAESAVAPDSWARIKASFR